MTVAHQARLAREHGLPLEYPLRGTKEQQRRQILNWFKSPIDWASIAGATASVEDQANWKWAQETFGREGE